MGSAAGALLLCCAVTLPIYIARGLGAGDVKFVAAAGAVLGLESVPDMLLGFALLAGVLGLGAIFLHPGRSMLLERWLALRDLPRRGIAAYRPPGSGDPGRIRLPMAPAISTAFLWALCGGTFF